MMFVLRKSNEILKLESLIMDNCSGGEGYATPG